jgi:hypothetical protein
MNATTPTNPAAASGTILALDLGKYKSAACLDDRGPMPTPDRPQP